ncbi:MAG TPA: hypothetical protein VIM18_06790 [Solirubrobacteraceae bacterium]
MTMGRSWKRQLFGASGAALLVPGAIAGALVILVFAGGFARLGTLGQALSGPALPGGSMRVSATPPGSGRSTLGRALAAAAAPAGAASGGTVAGTSSGINASRGGTPGSGGSRLGGTGSGGSGGGGTGGGGNSGSGGTPGSGGSGSGNPAGGSGGAGSPPPTPAPPSTVGKVVGAATAVTQQVPGPVGTVATQTLESVGSTVDRVLPLGDPVGALATKLGLAP